MSNELTILKLCKNKERMSRIMPSIPEAGFEEYTLSILKAIQLYWREFPDAKEIHQQSFRGWLETYVWAATPEDKRSLWLSVVDRMKEDVPAELERGIVERILSAEFVVSSLTMIEKWNSGDWEGDLLAEMQLKKDEIETRMQRQTKSPLITTSAEDLMKMDEHDIGLQWRLRCLRESMRGCRGGDFGILAMRPDAGKTTLVANETTHWLTQLDSVWPDQDRTGLWLNNEGPGSRIKARWFQAALGITTPEMVELAKEQRLTAEIDKALGCDSKRMLFYDIHDFYSNEVEQIIKHTRPGFVVFDMIDNIKFRGMGMNNGQRTDQLLEAMYQQARNWAVKYDFVGLATSQISADGDGAQWPSMANLKDSKTGKQGACDFIIMGGKLNDPAMDRFRYISTPKNKLHRSGGKRCPHAEVYFYADRARLHMPQDED